MRRATELRAIALLLVLASFGCGETIYVLPDGLGPDEDSESDSGSEDESETGDLPEETDTGGTDTGGTDTGGTDTGETDTSTDTGDTDTDGS